MTNVHTRDSNAIRIVRVLCIFFMTSVHLVPGPSNPSFISQGSGEIIGDIWLSFLGRASVATLSLISGFLLVGALEKYSVAHIIRDRARVLLIPAATWNLLMLVALLGFTTMGASVNRALPPLTPLGMTDAITGLFGPSINLSLFFLRDLFVSSALLVLLWRCIRSHLALALAAVFVLTVFELTAPIIFRPTILLFMLMGCALRAKRFPLSSFAVPKTVICGLLCSGAVWLGGSFIGVHDGPGAEILNIAKRTMLVFAMIAFSVALGRSKAVQAFFDRLEPVAYLAYLSHVMLSKLIWIAMSAAGLTLTEPSYLFYFFAAPVIIFAMALPLQRLINALPGCLPTLLKGKPAPKFAQPATAQRIRNATNSK
ncbi:MAG: acyltransferase [Pseudomonadota bacterium]